jgi:hypothetical protein
MAMATEANVRTMIVEMLAQLKRTTPAEIEGMIAGGERIGSHYFVRVLPKLRRRLGIKLKANPELSQSMRSLDELALYVHAAVQKEAA